MSDEKRTVVSGAEPERNPRVLSEGEAPGDAPQPQARSQAVKRWSGARKREVVLRLLRGESMELLSRQLQVPLHDLQAWLDTFIAAGSAALRSRPTTAAEVDLKKAQAKIGQLMMELELHEKKGALLALRRRSAS